MWVAAGSAGDQDYYFEQRHEHTQSRGRELHREGMGMHHHETDPTAAGSIGRLEVRLLGDDSEMSSMVSVIEVHPKFVPLAIVNGVLWIISKNVFVA